MTFDKSSFVVAVNIRGSKGGVTAGHHHGVVPDDEDPQPLTQVAHHLVLLLPQIPGKLLAQFDNGGQAHLVPAPNVSTASGRKVIASASHLSSYFRSLALCACSTALSPSSDALATSACWRGLTTVMSRAVSRPSVQMGMRTSAGRSSEPGRRPSGSLTGPSPASTAALKIASLTWLCFEIRSPPIAQEMA